MTTAVCKCSRQCGRPASAHGYSAACFKRWDRAGRPVSGPPEPLTPQESGRRSGIARGSRPAGGQDEPDAYDIAWAAGAGERRVMRVRRQAAHLVQVVQARDAAGFARLLEKISDVTPVLAVLAECADPLRTVMVTGVAVPGAAGPAEGSAGDGSRMPLKAVRSDRGAMAGEPDAA